MKTKLIALMGMGLLIGAGLIFSCGKAKEALSTPPADQTKIAQDAQASAVGIALGVKDIAISIMQGGNIGFAPASPFQPMAKFEWSNNYICPKSGMVELLPDGCTAALKAYQTGSCESLELDMNYADGCTEATVWKEGEASLKLEVIAQADLPDPNGEGYKLTASFTDFVEGVRPQKNGELIFSAVSSSNGKYGQLRIETGDSGYTEGDQESSGYAQVNYSVNGTVKKGLVAGTATEADLTLEAKITTSGSASGSIDVKYVIVSDMSAQPGDADAAITSIDISGTSTEWGSLTVSEGSLQLMAQGLKVDPACTKNPVAGTLGVKGTDKNDITYDVLLTFHSTCDGKAEAKITVSGAEANGTYEGTIPLTYAGTIPQDSILGQLIQGFTDTFNGIKAGLGKLGK